MHLQQPHSLLQKNRNIRFILVLFAAIALACRLSSPAAPVASPVASPSAFPPNTQRTQAGSVRVTAESTEVPWLAPIPQYNVSVTAKATQPGVTSLAVAGFPGVPEAVRDYLNRGGSPEELRQELEEEKIAGQPPALLSGDLDGNWKDDLTVAILDPASSTLSPDGLLLIYLGQEDHFELSYQQPIAGNPKLGLLQDLDADGRADLVASAETCGAHTCFEAVQIISWDGTQFINRLEGSSVDLPYPSIEVQDPDLDGVYQVLVSGTEYGSIGAGPTRSRTWIWSYDPGSSLWKKSDELLGESNYRVHIIQDADEAARNGGYDQALVLYQRGIADSTLQDWSDPSQEEANLGAYARFKMFFIYLIQGNQELAAIVYADLADTFPSGTSQHAFVEMATVFQEAFAGGDLPAGCSAVERYAAAHIDQVLLPLNSFGYANPVYTGKDLCP